MDSELNVADREPNSSIGPISSARLATSGEVLELDDGGALDTQDLERAPRSGWPEAAETASPWIAIADSRPSRREFVLNFLHSQKQLSERFVALSMNDLLGQNGATPANLTLIVCSIGGMSVGDPEVSVHFERILARYPSVPVVILSDLDDPEEVRFALAAGARGFVSTLLDPQLMCAALRLVRAGGKFAPPELFDEWIKMRADTEEVEPASEPIAQCNELTPRQTHVLQLLQKGLPNKVIATTLGMTESTVKVHVRQIMRRLGAKNRTEAALFAQRHLASLKRTVC